MLARATFAQGRTSAVSMPGNEAGNDPVGILWLYFYRWICKLYTSFLHRSQALLGGAAGSDATSTTAAPAEYEEFEEVFARFPVRFEAVLPPPGIGSPRYPPDP